mgnify:CR=1 FL=1
MYSREELTVYSTQTKKNWVWTFLEVQDIEKTPKRQVNRVTQKLPGATLRRAEW